MIRIRLWTTCLLTAFTLLISYAQTEGTAWQSRVDQRIFSELESRGTVEVIVLMEEQADLSMARLLGDKTTRGTYVYHELLRKAETSQARIREWLEREEINYRPFRIVNALYVVADSGQVEYLAKQNEVASIEYNVPMSFHQPVRTDYSDRRNPDAVEWGIEKIHADDVWAMGYDGFGVVIGGQDTGYEWDHDALIDRYRGWNGSTVDHNYNWHDAIHEIDDGNSGTNPCGLDSPEPCDDHNHGTHTMGTMVGSDGGIQIGVAPGAQWIGCRNMERGDGTPATYLECFDWFMAPTDLNGQNADPSKAPHVINNSWACIPAEGCDGGYDFSIMEAAILNLEAAGVVVVASAGNEGPNCGTVSNPPALYEASFSVGATNSSDGIASFSSRGPTSGYGSSLLKPNVSAPGVSVYSSIRNNSYATYSGTSMAGPHVAGAVALLIDADPSLSGDVDAIKNILEQTAVPLTTAQNCGGVSGTDTPNNTFGHGRIDVLAAVNFALGNMALEILNLQGLSKNNYILVTWETANQADERRMTLEKSTDRTLWDPVFETRTDLAGKFQYTDHQAMTGTNYYRIRIDDADGSFRHSEVIAVIHSPNVITALFPNPLMGQRVYIKTDEGQDEPNIIRIYALDGRQVLESGNPVSQSGLLHVYDVSHLNPGMYIITVSNANNRQIARTRLIRQ
jgi:subtilisin family serine protease